MIALLFYSCFLFLTVTSASYFTPDDQSYQHQLQPKLISQSVHLNEVPTKVIKVTKTVAIKVPVPYPVKVPHHIPIPVPVNRLVPIPVPQIVKVPHHVPVEINRSVPVEVHQQVPLFISKHIAIPHPVPVPHPIAIENPVLYSPESHSDYSSSFNEEEHSQIHDRYDKTYDNDCYQ